MNQMQEPIIVSDPLSLHRAVQNLSQQPAIAIDTESNSLHAYHEQVCLIQISTSEEDYLIDPLALKDLSGLKPVLADSAIQKIFHAGDYDIACLKRDFNFSFVNLFDTMLAATALAEPNLGLSGLVEKYLHVTLEKKFQRADWGARPLKPEMLAYAQADSHYLIALRDALVPLLKEKDRLSILLEDSEALGLLTPAMKNHEENLWRIKGVINLKPRTLSLLQALNHTRELLASAANLPIFKIISDQALIEIAQTEPKFIEELSLLPSLSRGQVRRFGQKIMTTVDHWHEKPAEIHRPRNGRLSAEQIERHERLSEWRKLQGIAEGVPSNVIMPKELLDSLTSHPANSLGELKQLMNLTPTRFERYGRQILTILKEENQ